MWQSMCPTDSMHPNFRWQVSLKKFNKSLFERKLQQQNLLQGLFPHVWVETLEPIHWLPPFDGAGLSHLRDRSRTPVNKHKICQMFDKAEQQSQKKIHFLERQKSYLEIFEPQHRDINKKLWNSPTQKNKKYRFHMWQSICPTDSMHPNFRWQVWLSKIWQTHLNENINGKTYCKDDFGIFERTDWIQRMVVLHSMVLDYCKNVIVGEYHFHMWQSMYPIQSTHPSFHWQVLLKTSVKDAFFVIFESKFLFERRKLTARPISAYLNGLTGSRTLTSPICWRRIITWGIFFLPQKAN